MELSFIFLKMERQFPINRNDLKLPLFAVFTLFNVIFSPIGCRNMTVCLIFINGRIFVNDEQR